MQDRPPTATEHAHRTFAATVAGYAAYLLDLEGRVSSWNSAAHRIHGYAAEEIVGQPVSVLFAAEDRHLGRPEADLHAARLGSRLEAEGWRVRKDGSRFWVLAVLDVLLDRTGAPIGFVQAIRDLTDRREMQQSLLASERRFRLLVQGVTDYAIFMLDTAGRVTDW